MSLNLVCGSLKMFTDSNRPEEISQWLGAISSFLEYLSSDPSTYMKHSSRIHGCLHTYGIHLHRHTYKLKKKHQQKQQKQQLILTLDHLYVT